MLIYINKNCKCLACNDRLESRTNGHHQIVFFNGDALSDILFSATVFNSCLYLCLLPSASEMHV